MANPKSLLADENLLKFLANKDLLFRDLSGADRTNLKTEIETVKQLMEKHKTVLEGLLDNLVQIDTDIKAEEAANTVQKKAAA